MGDGSGHDSGAHRGVEPLERLLSRFHLLPCKLVTGSDSIPPAFVGRVNRSEMEMTGGSFGARIQLDVADVVVSHPHLLFDFEIAQGEGFYTLLLIWLLVRFGCLGNLNRIYSSRLFGIIWRWENLAAKAN